MAIKNKSYQNTNEQTANDLFLFLFTHHLHSYLIIVLAILIFHLFAANMDFLLCTYHTVNGFVTSYFGYTNVISSIVTREISTKIERRRSVRFIHFFCDGKTCERIDGALSKANPKGFRQRSVSVVTRYGSLSLEKTVCFLERNLCKSSSTPTHRRREEHLRGKTMLIYRENSTLSEKEMRSTSLQRNWSN